jgi:hypothetical protein
MVWEQEMHAETGTGFGRLRLTYLLAMFGLVFGLFLPGAAAAQGIKDRPSTDEPATEEATQTSDPADLEAAGLVGRRSYESPQFGYTIDWSRDWDVDSYYEPPVVSSEDDEQDLIYLVWSDGSGSEAYAIFSGQTASRGGGDADVEEWTDPDYIAEQWNANFDVEPLLDDTTRDAGAVLFSVVDTDNDSQYYTVYQSIELEDGTTLYLTFSSHEDSLEDAYTSWSEDVEINGEPIDVVFTWADIEGAI